MSTQTFLNTPQTNMLRRMWDYKTFHKGSWIVHGVSAAKTPSEYNSFSGPSKPAEEQIELYAPGNQLNFYSLKYLEYLEKREKELQWDGVKEILDAWRKKKSI